MQAIYDHLQAVMLAGAVLLILAAVGQSTLEGMIGGTRFHEKRVKQTALISQMKQDIRNIGAGGATNPLISGSGDGELIIKAPPSQGKPAAEIRYSRVEDGTGPNGYKRYRLERYVDGTLTLESSPLTGWTVACVDANGDTLAFGSSDTKGLSVTLEARPRGDYETRLPQRWESVIYPYHLTH